MSLVKGGIGNIAYKLGKTIIPAIVAVHRLHRLPEDHVIILAPTKPLAYHSGRGLRKALRILSDQIVTITGKNL